MNNMLQVRLPVFVVSNVSGVPRNQINFQVF